MGTPRKLRRTLLCVFAIVFDLLALVNWAARPAPIYSDWLGLAGDPRYAPLSLVRTWLTGVSAPWTPTGLLSIFEPEDLTVGVALIVGFVLLTIALVMTWAVPRPIPEIRARLRWRGLGRFRVRTVLVAIAVIGLYLGCELESWRLWKLGRYHLRKVHDYTQQERNSVSSVQRWQADLTSFETITANWPDKTDRPEAREASRAAYRDSLLRQLTYAESMVAFTAQLKRKHEHAVAHPWSSVDSDPQSPQADQWPNIMGKGGDAGNVAACDEQIRRYPALASAHQRRAWILATSPDPQVRDGEAAVASAMRACELTNGMKFNVLATLAASYAEAGDFRRAVASQQRALDRIAAGEPEGDYKQLVLKQERERLALYKERRPFRHQHGAGFGGVFATPKGLSGTPPPKPRDKADEKKAK
jgi:hypothetical protein